MRCVVSPLRWHLLLGLVLLSGAGLTVMVGASLADRVTAAGAQARRDAEARARDQAQTVRLWLRSPENLEQLPPANRFVVHAGRVVVPPEVGWLTQRDAPPPDLAGEERLQRAHHAEFVAHEPQRAAALFEQLLAELGERTDPTLALRLQLLAGWQQRRAGQPTAAAELLQPVHDALQARQPADLADPRLADVAASALLLATALGQSPPAWAEALAPALPDGLADATFGRLAELGAGAFAATLQQAAATCHQQRRTLLAARNLLPTLPAGALLAPTRDDLVLVWHGEAGDGSEAALAGRGALLDAATLARVLTTTLPGLLPLQTTEPTHPAVEVLPGRLWLVPPPQDAAGTASLPFALAGGALALLLTLGGSLWFGARAMRRELAAMRLRSEFLTGVTHELKTPVASIRLIAEVLHDDPVEPARQRDYFALLAGETARLSMLIDNVLDLGQIERGERAYTFAPLDLGELLQRTLALFAPLAERAGLQLHVQLPDEPLPADADAAALGQALLAVLENARKYAVAGQRLVVTATRAPQHLRIVVRDHGPGVPAAEREAIFARFVRGSRHRHGSVPGIGLGLHLARRIAERHGGSLHCEAPANGPGAAFVFLLPLATARP